MSKEIPPHLQPPLMEMPDLPKADPTRKLTLAQYMEYCKNHRHHFDPIDFSNDTMKKIVLQEIAKHPDIWSSQKGKSYQKSYPQIAVDVFKRSGFCLSVPSIKSIYKCAKDNLRNRLRIAIVRNRLSAEDVEKYMWKWDYYGFIRFYRVHTQHWEAELFKEAQTGIPALNRQAAAAQANAAKRSRISAPAALQHPLEDYPVEMEDDPYDDYGQDEYAGAHVDPKFSNPKTSRVNEHQIDYTVYLPPPPAEEYDDQESQVSQEVVDNHLKSNVKLQEHDYQMPGFHSYIATDVTDCVSSSSTSALPANPQAMTDFREELAQITYQANRVAREQPDAIKTLRRSLFDVVLAFDDKQYKNVGDLFQELANKYSKTA